MVVPTILEQQDQEYEAGWRFAAGWRRPRPQPEVLPMVEG